MTEFLPVEISKQLNELDLVLQTSHSIPEIPELLNGTVLLGGKRLRPALCFLVGGLLGAKNEQLAPFARAAEFTHSASLAHDDVLDNANVRRNLPTLKARTSNARAVLAGDLLLARVMVELSEVGRVDIIRDLALTVEDLVNGEWLQLMARNRMDITETHLLEVARRKTASLMGWSSRVAAMVSPAASTQVVEAASEFGINLGVAFQMVDDVIDFENSSQKEYAKDFREGLVNFVVAELLSARPELRSDLEPAFGTDSAVAWPTEALELAKSRVREKAGHYLHRASECLEVLASNKSESESSARCLESLNGILLVLGARYS